MCILCMFLCNLDRVVLAITMRMHEVQVHNDVLNARERQASYIVIIMSNITSPPECSF